MKDIIIKPVLTEKATNLVKSDTYTFEVHTKASKYQIADMLEHMYKVKVAAIRTMTRQGKTRRAGRKMQTRVLPVRKLAYVKLKEGTIDLFPKA